jgi:acylphosphatase
MLYRLSIRVSGRVQGVGFRYFTLEAAESAGGITGYVRNEETGRSVEIYAEGERPDLERLLSLVKEGPSLSHVAEAATDWQQIQRRQYEQFTIAS